MSKKRPNKDTSNSRAADQLSFELVNAPKERHKSQEKKSSVIDFPNKSFSKPKSEKRSDALAKILQRAEELTW